MPGPEGSPTACWRLAARPLLPAPRQVRPIRLRDFEAALRAIKPSVSRDQMRRFEEWTREYGMST